MPFPPARLMGTMSPLPPAREPDEATAGSTAALGRALLLLGLGALLLLSALFVPPSLGAVTAATSSPSASSITTSPAASAALAAATPSWAYGGVRYVSGSGSGTDGNGNSIAYSFHGMFAFSAVLNQTNTSSTTFSIQAFRTQAALIYIDLCSPSCSSPTATGNITIFGWEQENAVANFSRTASVDVNGTAVPALGVVSVFDQIVGNMTRVSVGQFNSRTFGAYASVAAQATASLAFTPALGLVPISVTPGESWSSNSSYTEQGSWSAPYHMYQQNQGAMNGDPQGSLQSSGTLGLSGQDTGGITLGNGVLARALLFHTWGPFSMRDGWLPVPFAADLFAGGGHAWDSQTPMGAAIQPGTTDLQPTSPHMGVLAAGNDFVSDAALGVQGYGSSAGPSASLFEAAAALSAPPASEFEVQAQPMSIGSAEQLAGNMLVPPVYPAWGSPATRLLPLVLTVVVIGAVAAVVAIVVVRRRRQGGTSRGRADGYEAYRPSSSRARTSSVAPSGAPRSTEPRAGPVPQDAGFEDLI